MYCHAPYGIVLQLYCMAMSVCLEFYEHIKNNFETLWDHLLKLSFFQVRSFWSNVEVKMKMQLI